MLLPGRMGDQHFSPADREEFHATSAEDERSILPTIRSPAQDKVIEKILRARVGYPLAGPARGPLC